MRRHFAEQEAEREFDESDASTTGRQEWRRMKVEFRELTEELKAALWGKIEAPAGEKARILEILRHALAAIRQK